MKYVFDYCEEYLLSLTSTWYDFLPKKKKKKKNGRGRGRGEEETPFPLTPHSFFFFYSRPIFLDELARKRLLCRLGLYYNDIIRLSSPIKAMNLPENINYVVHNV